MVIRYGVISDIHEDPRVVVPALEVLKDEGVDKAMRSQGYPGWSEDNCRSISPL